MVFLLTDGDVRYVKILAGKSRKLIGTKTVMFSLLNTSSCSANCKGKKKTNERKKTLKSTKNVRLSTTIGKSKNPHLFFLSNCNKFAALETITRSKMLVWWFFPDLYFIFFSFQLTQIIVLEIYKEHCNLVAHCLECETKIVEKN